MTSAQVIDVQGKKLREVELKEDVFGIKPNTDVMHSALLRQLANARTGSANSKTRSEVRGGGKKPWRQKGTGRARAGSTRSPLWEGGGVIFGPKPRDFSVRMPRKQRVLALKSALAARKDNLVVVDDFSSVKEGKTKEIAKIYKDLKVEGKKVVLVLDFACESCELVERGARNIEGTKVLHVNNLNVKDLIGAEVVLTTERTLDAINKRFEPQAEKSGEKAKAKSAPVRKAAEPGAAKTTRAKSAGGETEPKAKKAKTTETKSKSAKPKSE